MPTLQFVLQTKHVTGDEVTYTDEPLAFMSDASVVPEHGCALLIDGVAYLVTSKKYMYVRFGRSLELDEIEVTVEKESDFNF